MRRGLALPFGNDPMLDSDRTAAVPIGPTGDVSDGIDSGDIRLQVFVDDNAVVDGDPGTRRKRHVRLHSNARDDEIGCETFAVRQNDRSLFDRRRRRSEMEDNAMLFVDGLDHVTEFGS